MGTESHILIHDIVDGHEERMSNLKKFYPFFRLCEQSLIQFRDGRYEDIDMGYVTMAVLRFFIEENSFNERKVSYEAYEAFLRELLYRDFDVNEDEASVNALIQYIFDKLNNDGRPFYFDYYEPRIRQKKRGRTRLIESSYDDGKLQYALSSDAIEFYLETKETKDESKISIEQLLLGKMIRSRNFRGGADVIRRINGEVTRLMLKQSEIVTLLSYNIFEGIEALEDFSKRGMQWFEEEQKLFDSNLELVKQALLKAREENYQTRTMDEIYYLNQELKRVMERHEALLAACTNLQVLADEMLLKAKHSRFRRRMDFSELLRKAMVADDTRLLESMTAPLFGLKIRKTFQMERLDDLLLCRPEGVDTGDPVTEGIEESYIFEDEVIDERIRHNHQMFLHILFDALLQKKTLTLEELHHLYRMKLTDNVLRNGDYYAFLSHLAQKNEYLLGMVKEKPDTFLEEIMAEMVIKDRKREYEDLRFTLEFIPDEQIDLGSMGYFTNIRFERRGM